MNFLNPAFLIGLPLVAVPVAIHLLNRRQQKRIPWGAMRFLKAAATRRRRLWQLTDLLLLLIRTAAFLLFIFALSRPLLPASWLGNSNPREIILVLDQSMSMSRRQGDASLFDLQIQKAHTLLHDLHPRDSVRILLAGEAPEWLTPEAVAVNPDAIRQLDAQLDTLKQTEGAADLITCVREAANQEAPKDKSARLIVVISDAQRFGWRMEEAPLWKTIKARLQDAAIPSSVQLHFVSAPPVTGGNLCVNRIEVPHSVTAINQPITLTAHVQNRGVEPSTPTLLTWQAGEQSLGLANIPELAPGASTSVSVSHQFSAAGVYDVSCRLESRDALMADNEAHLLVETVERLPVLLVEEPNATQALDTDSAFVLAGLGARKTGGAKPGWRSVFEPTVIAPGALADTELSQFKCIFLLDVRALTPTSIKKLEAYVRSGGGVWIALGAQTEEKFFNEHLHRGGLGLAPLKLTSPVGDPNDRENFFTIRPTSDTHPATILLSDLQRLDTDKVRVFRRHQFDRSSGQDVSALLQVQNGDPIVVERKLGQGRVVVQGFPLGVSWSTLPLCQVYVATLHEWLWYLADSSLPKHNLAVGEAIVEPVQSKGAMAELRRPDNLLIPLQTTTSSSGTYLHFTGTRLPGEYKLKIQPEKGDATEAKFRVKRNPEESDLAPLSEKDLEQFRTTKPFQIGGRLDAPAADETASAPQHPLEGWLLTTLACALVGELILAGWLTHRRHLRLTPVPMDA
ncbi:BatA domain-containing protein [Verrucomicrobiota bacterium sgz303538]